MRRQELNKTCKVMKGQSEGLWRHAAELKWNVRWQRNSFFHFLYTYSTLFPLTPVFLSFIPLFSSVSSLSLLLLHPYIFLKIVRNWTKDGPEDWKKVEKQTNKKRICNFLSGSEWWNVKIRLTEALCSCFFAFERSALSLIKLPRNI